MPSRVRAGDLFWGFSGSFTYGACPTCRSWVLNPRPTPQAIAPFYARYYDPQETDDRRKAYATKSLGRAGGVDHMRAAGIVHQLKALGLDWSKSRLLDAGCGLACFARSVRELTGAQVRGVDFDPACRTFAADVHHIEVDTGELNAQAYPDGHFDVVTSWHCLEHTFDPQAELNELARITRSGGWLVLEVPTPGLIGRLFGGAWLFLQAPTHLYHLRPSALRTLAERAGFEVIKSQRPWLPTELAGSLVLALGCRGGFIERMFRRNRATDVLWRLLFGALLIIDVPLTFLLALFGDSGVARITARRT